MKRNTSLFGIFVLFLAVAFAFSGCGNKTTQTEEPDTSGPEYTSAYVCPMHCPGSGGSEPGKCPVCEMDYVKNPDYKGEEPSESEPMENMEDDTIMKNHVHMGGDSVDQ